MSTSKETAHYMELQPGDAVQNGDQWRDSFGQWQPYASMGDDMGIVGYGVKARRPIRTTHQTAFEEVPGSRTTQQAMDQPQRERIAYEELQPGDVIQAGDEWRNPDGRWHPLVVTPGASLEVRGLVRTRRPYKISTILEIGDALANAQKAATQLQDERDEAQAEVVQLQLSRQECIDRCNAEIISAVQASEQLFAAMDALKSAQRARDELQLQVDELRAERERLQGLIDNLLDEPTARQVQDMLRTWATELDWAAGCFDSVGRDKVSAAQRVLVVAIERIGSMIDPEDNSASN